MTKIKFKTDCRYATWSYEPPNMFWCFIYRNLFNNYNWYYFQLIEVLLILQNLQESGEDGYRAERAFYHYMGDVDKTKDHLMSSKQVCCIQSILS